jgi:O-methyltransferase
MKELIFKPIPTIKNILLLLRLHVLLGFLIRPLSFLSNFLALSRWAAKQPKNIYKDSFSLVRNYERRYDLYRHVIEQENLRDSEITYIELGVCWGVSFKWWMQNNENVNSRFYGFDTFEGLPEDWGLFYKSGEMVSSLPELNDSRGKLFKGLFQDTLPPFVSENTDLKNKRKVIHLDADLFSSTIFSLAVLYPYLQKGDIIFFDEFNVPDHEFLAYKIFTESFYVNLTLIGAVNNYYHSAFKVS